MDLLFMQSAANCNLPELIKVVPFFFLLIFLKNLMQCFHFLFSLFQLKEITE